MNINDLLNKMEAAEDAFLQTEFLTPVLPYGQVRVRIAGVVCTLRVVGEREPGWAILKPRSLGEARVVGKPGLKQVREFLSLFPAVRLILVARGPEAWLALPAQQSDNRFRLSGPVSVEFVQGAAPFQQVLARFDGSHFWFEEIDRRRSPAIAAYLRDALQAETPPDNLHKATLTSEERAAYLLALRAVEAARRDRVEVRLAEALAHAGAEFASYIERDDTLTVTYTVDGRAHRSTVQKDDFSVMVAGICLSGQDRRFDLQSLVGVLREGKERNHLVYVGDEGMDEEAYWDVHPANDGEE